MFPHRAGPDKHIRGTECIDKRNKCEKTVNELLLKNLKSKSPMLGLDSLCLVWETL